MENNEEAVDNAPANDNDMNVVFDSQAQHPNLLDEALEVMAQGHLIYLYAALRLLSATGRISTKFETLCIDSDLTKKTSAAEVAVLPETNGKEMKNIDGVSPALIISVLIIELRREVLKIRKLQKNDGRNDDDMEEADASILSTIIDPKGRKMIEDDIHSLLQAYNNMLGRDLKTEVPQIDKSYFRGKFDSIVDKIKHTANPHAASSSSRDNEDFQSFEATLNVSDSKTEPNKQVRIFTPDFWTHRSTVMQPVHEHVDFQEFEKVGDTIFAMSIKQKSSSSLLKDERMGNMTEEELLDFMEKAVESRIQSRFGFMEDFFKDGSVMQLMVKSQAKVVWLNDWYPIKDCIFIISINEEKKEVMVVFRGATTSTDWSHCFDATFQKTPNPVMDDYEGKKELIKIHRGFYSYLFRRRKDTNTRKYDEITNKVQYYGSKMGNGYDYKVVVTGHSLGAALATLFGFYASTEARFTVNGPVKIFTFGGPYVAGYSFSDAFKHQERMEKVQYARFYNSRDWVTHLPLNFRRSRRGSKFRHVGVGIRLPRYSCVDGLHPKVKYIYDEGYWQSYVRALWNNCFLHLAWPCRIKLVHSLEEHQKRIQKGKTLSKDKDYLSNKSLNEIYQELVYNRRKESFGK